MGRYPPSSAHPAHLVPRPLYYIIRTRNSTGWSVRTQSLAPDQSTMIIQRRISSKKTTNVWTAKTHYYALRTDFHFLCRGLRTGIFYTVMPIWYWILSSVQQFIVEFLKKRYTLKRILTCFIYVLDSSFSSSSKFWSSKFPSNSICS